MEVGVFIATVRLKRTHFRKERLDRVHIGELKESYIGLGRRSSFRPPAPRATFIDDTGLETVSVLYAVGPWQEASGRLGDARSSLRPSA